MTREEAIERIKTRFDKWALDDEDMKAIQTLIPELAESEDERIREWLVYYFKAIGKSWLHHRDISIEQILAYLEKQKEQKPMYNLEIPTGDVAPAEENGPFDEDEFLENELSAFLQNYDKEYDDDAAVSDVARHFYEIGKKQKEQKEQKKKNVLIWGEPQVTITVQKQEWSEEDEEMLEYVIGDLNDAKQLFHAKDAIDLCDKEIAWLKSLRPSWKPSEEQMAALRRAVNKLAKTDVADSVRLSVMSDNLKKL